MAATPRLHEDLTRTHDLVGHLKNDVERAFEELHADRECQYRRRATVRAVFSLLEGATSTIKWELCRDLRHGRIAKEVPKDTEEFLHEQRVRRDGTHRPLFVPLERNLSETFAVASSLWDLEFQLDLDRLGQGTWSRAHRARNRLAHPKIYYDIEITNGEIEALAHTYVWFVEEFSRFWRTRIAALARTWPARVREKLFALHTPTTEGVVE